MGVGFSSNYPLAPLTDKAYRFRSPSELKALSMTATGVTDIVNVTEAGKMLGWYIDVDAALDGSPEIDLEITVDGGTKESIVIYNAANSFAVDTWKRVLAFSATNNTGQNGGSVGDQIRIMFDCPYLSSLKVSINVRVAASTVGALNAGVFRATEQ